MNRNEVAALNVGKGSARPENVFCLSFVWFVYFVVNPAAAFGFNAKAPRCKGAMKANQAAGEAETENTKGKEGSAGGNTIGTTKHTK